MYFKTLGHHFIEEIIKNLPEKATKRLPIVDFLETHRYLPFEVSKEHYGFFNIEKVPHLREILETLEPEHPAKHISIIKSVQSGLTTSVAEGAIAFYVYYQLGSILSLTSNKQISKIRGSAIDVMIDNTEGLAEKLQPMSKRANSGKNKADTTQYKEFIGGIQLLQSSYGSIASMKSIPYNLIVRDEWAEAPQELKGQGSLDGLIEGRTMATQRYKILSLSTPARSGSCQMERSFLLGDQREYFMPCPHCGTMQVLVMKNAQDRHGLTFQTERAENGQFVLVPETVQYNCIKCPKPFFFEHRRAMLAAGEWRPCWSEKAPKTPNHWSYHISGLISPFLSWERICYDYIKTNMGQDILEYKNFSINILGEAWKHIEAKPNWQVFKDRADDYCLGEVPDAGNTGGLILVGGADIQQNRIELCVCAIGEGIELWLVEYERFHFKQGDEHNLQGEGWADFAKYVIEYRHPILGKINVVAVDTGFNPIVKPINKKVYSADEIRNEQLVKRFCLNYGSIFTPVKGSPKAGMGVIIPQKKRKTHDKPNEIYTDDLKHLLFDNIHKTRGYYAIHFPKWGIENNKRYELSNFIYQSFCSEQFSEGLDGEMHWVKMYMRNEVLDCIVYSLACVFIKEMQSWTKPMWQDYREFLADKEDA